MAGSIQSRLAPGPAPPITEAPLFLGEGVAVDGAGNLFLADRHLRQVRKLTPDGSIVVLLGPAELSLPTGLAVDPAGYLFVADSQKHRVLKVAPDGSWTTVAGTGAPGCSGDGGPATAAQLHGPWGLAVDRRGQLLIADAGNHRVRRVAREGSIATVAGAGTAGFSGDGGLATAARLDRPLGVAVDSRGNLFIVDSLNGRIRKVDREGRISTVFGGCAGEEGEAARPAGYYPAGVAVDREGNLLVADPFHRRVLKIPGVAAPGLIAGRHFPIP